MLIEERIEYKAIESALNFIRFVYLNAYLIIISILFNFLINVFLGNDFSFPKLALFIILIFNLSYSFIFLTNSVFNIYGGTIPQLKKIFRFYFNNENKFNLRCKSFDLILLLRKDLINNTKLILNGKNESLKRLTENDLFLFECISNEDFNKLYNAGIYKNLPISIKEEKIMKNKLKDYRENKLKTSLLDF
jgi:hypothetical protein